jgi:hypothetical protein
LLYFVSVGKAGCLLLIIRDKKVVGDNVRFSCAAS